MPVTLVDRLPLPNLKVYTAGSVLLLSIAVYFAVNVTSDPNWRANATLQRQEPGAGGAEGNAAKMVQPLDAPNELLNNATKNVTEQFIEVMTFMMQEPLCMWTLINMAYCSLAVFGCFIQRLVFGKLRVAEAQRVKDKFWNYVFYKFIFVFGVLNVQYMDEVLLWCSWFTLIGFLHLLGQLCKDRFDYVSVDPQLTSSPSAARWAHTRLLCLLVGILAASMCLFGAAVAWGLPAGKDTFAFMAAECLLVAIATLHVLARFFLRVQDADAAGPASYYTHLIFDAAGLVTETCHVAHMVVYSNVVVSMASVVLLMQLRHLLHALLARLRRHRLYSALATHMSRNYPMASPEEVRKNEDNCAICWEPMKEARKLPCAHLFHNSCLCRWVQQDASCPTCRRALSAAPDAPAPAHPAHPRVRPHHAMQGGPNNHLFHFDGSRYVSWLPSFSVEVTRVRDAANARAAAGLTGGLPGLPGGLTGGLALESMVRQVQQLFPQMPHSVLAADLAMTRSPDMTIDNILEGRLLAPPSPPSPPAVVVADRLNDASAIAASIVAPTAATTTVATSTADETRETDLENAIQFSQSAPERETLLRRRKDALLATARRRYLERVTAQTAQTAQSAQTTQPTQPTQPAQPVQPAQTAQTAQPAHVARS